MSATIYKAVSEVSFEGFTAAFNRAYSDYFMPIIMTSRAFRALIDRDDLDLSASVAALEDGTIVGTGLLGIRGSMGWIGGMGVVPERRRHGIGRMMMHQLLEHAHERHLTRVYLEVIEANHGAYNLYRQIGFEENRYLLVLDRKPGEIPAGELTYAVEECPADTLLNLYDEFHDVPNCWQRAYPSLAGLIPHVEGHATLQHDQIAGYALGWSDQHEIRIADLATAPRADRVAAGLALLTFLHQQYPDAYGSSYNVGEDDPALDAYLNLGYETSLRQIEMLLTL